MAGNLGEMSLASSVADDGDLPPYRLCKFCHRSSRTPNPLVSYVPGRFLKWRRPKGRECASCPWLIASVPEYVSMDKDALEKMCTEDEFRSTFSKKLFAWEENKNATNGERDTRHIYYYY